MALGIEIIKVDPGTTRVKLSGMLDTETAEQLDRRMADVLADATTRAIRMELHELSFISSMGLGKLAKIRKAMAVKGGVMVVVGAQPQIARVFDIVKMLPKEIVFATREEADEYLAAIQKNVLEENRPVNPDVRNSL
jgi:stage II sporulation protein AA (anti-sigma F factor antagonist)